MSLRVIPMSANSRSLNWESSCTASPYRFQLWKKRITGDNMGFVLSPAIGRNHKGNMGFLYCIAIKLLQRSQLENAWQDADFFTPLGLLLTGP